MSACDNSSVMYYTKKYLDIKMERYKSRCYFLFDVVNNLNQLENLTVREATSKLLKQLNCYMKNCILLNGKPINWEEYKAAYKTGVVDLTTMLGLGGLRKLTIYILVHQQDKFTELKDCYQELGSTDPTSDLDFTLISFNEPMYTLQLMVRFYNTFQSLYGFYPDIVFDTNYYVCNTIVPSSCFVPNPNLNKLFCKCDDYYRLYFSDTPESTSFIHQDAMICYIVLREKEYNIQHHKSPASLKRLVQSAFLYFSIINYVLTNGITNDKANKVIQTLRTLYFIMALRSNESYIHDGTFLQIVKKKKVTLIDQFLSFIDNYLFILEWFHKSPDYFFFFDACCKYIHRAAVALHETDFNVDPLLSELCHEYRSKYRGKYSFEELSTKEEVKELFSKIHTTYPTVNDLMTHLHGIYMSISTKYFGEYESAQKFTQQMFMTTKNVHVETVPHLVIVECSVNISSLVM